MKKKTYNVNVICKIVLTKYGYNIVKRSPSDHLLKDANWYDEKTRTLKMQLWCIMAMFGDCLWMGNNNIPFEKNEITILEDT
jgi:hypothetical protein